MQWIELKKIEATKIAETFQEDYNNGNDPLAGRNYSSLNSSYLEIRKKLIELFGDDSKRTRYTYSFDFEFGLGMYVYLRTKLGMTEADASNDDIWRYIQMKVVPDIIIKRWPFKNGMINAKRLYKNPSRMYLKVLWWYIHILWDNDGLSTRTHKAQVDISQIIDRSGGSEGNSIELYKEILHVYGRVDQSKRTNLIERVLMLDASYRTVIEPELTSGGLHKYVVDLYKELGIDVE